MASADGRAASTHPGHRLSDRLSQYIDTFDVGWGSEALEALFEGEGATLYDWPTRSWVTIRAHWFHERKPLLLQLRRILRDDYGIVAGQGGRRR